MIPAEEEAWSKRRWESFVGMLRRVRETNSFQRERFSQLAECDDWEGFEDFVSACPFTTKDELARDREKTPPYGTNLTFAPERYSHFHQTSGTLGNPMAWLDTQEDWDWMLANWDCVLEAAEVDPGARCYFAFSFGPFLGFWTAYGAARKRGCLCMPGGGQGTEQRLRAILEHEAEYLFCTPTYALRLPEVAETAGIDLDAHALKAIVVAGETGGSVPAFRERVTRAWGNDLIVHDHYGMTEVGPVAFETPGGQGGLRILLESYYPEIIDPERCAPVADGETGELVLTTLGREGCPVFRYRTGDLVRAERGKDASGLPTFDLAGGILGRSDDMVVVRGVNLYPSSVDAVVRRFPEVAEYQVLCEEKGAMTEVSLRAEASEEAARALEAALKEAFSLRISVDRVGPNSLPRYEMKAKRWLR